MKHKHQLLLQAMPNLESSLLWISKELPEGQMDKQDAQIDRQLEFKNAKMNKVGELIQFHRWMHKMGWTNRHREKKTEQLNNS